MYRKEHNGAIKAVTASQIALESDPTKAKVTLDGVIRTMKVTQRICTTNTKKLQMEGWLCIYPLILQSVDIQAYK